LIVLNEREGLTVKRTTQRLAAFFFFCSILVTLPLFGDAGDPPNRVARLSYMEGAVSFEPSGENDWSQASLNYPLTSGDRLWTDKGARAELDTGNLAIRLAEQTDLTTTSLTDTLIQLGLAQGTLRIRTYDMRSDHEVEVDTPNAALTTVQSGNYRVEVYPDQNMTLVIVNSGQLQISGNGADQTLQSGQAAQLTGTNPVQVNAVSVPSSDSFDQWSDQRDALYAGSRSRQYVNPYVPGYYDLDQYGSWNTVAEYGPVWYPSNLPGGWCPYRYGRWAWVEPWGWTWVDTEPWGFAPFHYGRWVQVGPRWGWLPGPVAVAPIYGPAFVAFIGGSGFSVGFAAGGVAAWFPLGPGEPFYPWYHHSDGYLRQVNITNVRNVTNITNITNVTNINNVQYRYRTVATTAVPANAFRSSQPVAHNLVKVNPQQLARAQVVPHPEVTPESRAITAGAPVAHPRVPAARPTVVQHAPVTRPGQPVTNARNVPPPVQKPNEPVASNPRTPQLPNRTATETTPHENVPPERTVPQPPNRPAPPVAQEKPTPPAATPIHNAPPPTTTRVEPNQTREGPPQNRPALVSKYPPPQEKLPFDQRAPAMQEHPGRPLEPQQRQNIRAGQPAGPMVDKEFPPHPAPAPSRPAATPHPPQSHSEPAKPETPKH
jgi:hypothetical protein